MTRHLMFPSHIHEFREFFLQTSVKCISDGTYSPVED